MVNFLERLRSRLRFLDSGWFNWVIGATLFLNPIALSPQLIRVITAPSIEGLSVSSFLLFAFIQLAFVAVGIQKLDWRMFLAMSISVVETMTIVIIVLTK